MKNTSKTKKESMAGKIFFRIIAAVIALTVIPSAIFLPLFKIVLKASFLDYGLGEEISISELSDFITQDDLKGILEFFSGEKEIGAQAKPIVAPVVCFLIFFALSLIMSIVIFFFAALSNMKKTIFFESLGGIALVIAAMASFTKASNLIVSGTVSLINLFGDGILTKLLNFFINVDTLKMGSAMFIMMTSFICLAAWVGAYLMTEIGENKKG